MATKTAMEAGKKTGILQANLSLKPSDITEHELSRADLVFAGVDHSGMSYEVRVFLNNPEADEDAPRTLEEGYAGRFIILGHGGCFGDIGHCDIPRNPRSLYDLLPQHPLTPQTKIVTITDALKNIPQNSPNGLELVTLVPISKDPLHQNQGLTDKLFKFDDMVLQIYQ